MGPVETGTAKDLADLPARFREGALGQLALELARQLDAQDNSATSKSMCAKALNETMARLADLAPARREKDRIDDLSARRNKRLTGT